MPLFIPRQEEEPEENFDVHDGPDDENPDDDSDIAYKLSQKLMRGIPMNEYERKLANYMINPKPEDVAEETQPFVPDEPMAQDSPEEMPEEPYNPLRPRPSKVGIINNRKLFRTSLK